jgi:hypothetical protein
MCLFWYFTGCSVCNPGWFMDAEKGCMDVNECFISPSPCKRNEFCVNNEGSYTCLGNVYCYDFYTLMCNTLN